MQKIVLFYLLLFFAKESLAQLPLNKTTRGYEVAESTKPAAIVEAKESPIESVAAKNKNSSFSIVFLPDTQYYTSVSYGGNNEMYKAQTRWIVNNSSSRNIAYIGGLGDCTDHGDLYEVEWKRVDTAMRPVENSNLNGVYGGIPYGLSVGNHDQSPIGSALGTTNFYNKYFGINRFSGRPYYGGHYGSNNDNHYEKFTAAGIDFMVISLEYDITSGFLNVGGPLAWAESLVKNNPTRKVIIMSHYILNEDATFSPQGSALYNRLKYYKNFMMMVGGHIDYGIGAARRTDTYNGNTVHSFLSDFQSHKNGGDGLMRVFDFNTQNNTVDVETFSPYRNYALTDSRNKFSISVALKGTSARTMEENTIVSFNESQENEIDVENKPSLINVFPNPSNTNKFSFSLPDNLKGKVSVEAFDEDGKVQYQKTFTEVKGAISLDHYFPKGKYTLKFTSAKGSEMKKVMVLP